MPSQTFQQILYVRSIKDWVEYRKDGSSYKKQREYLSNDDQKAKELLDGLYPPVSIVNLTKCRWWTKMRAMIADLHKTPALVVYGKKYKGLDDIERFLEEPLRIKLNEVAGKRVKISFRNNVQHSYSVTLTGGIVVFPPSEKSDFFHIGPSMESYSIVYLVDVECVEDEKSRSYRRGKT